jgi:hypothetical protein
MRSGVLAIMCGSIWTSPGSLHRPFQTAWWSLKMSRNTPKTKEDQQTTLLLPSLFLGLAVKKIKSSAKLAGS